ncbi:T9SS type A sorting domain-containing protein [Ichthyenterobacterium magnum]|uniref:Putative secreted protein (Por secretion system target) n=1 Tax=Ichthyenterobacterium magnum TaxID=1230530 RepID=A0A420DES9_9FLAO|nr:T9SS type A sorting domain-containing protein [Ichthyenterobacterium magnum]RKE90861.1 putative secreted protein (Por secretion system target) [Ichthyenterobacterium magnum]
MKTKLLYLFSILTGVCYSQSPINNYNSAPMTTYAIVTSGTAIDQSTGGSNLIWDFTNLTQVGGTTDTYASPTAGELTTYPGTTSVLTITDAAMVESKGFIKDVAGEVSLTGIEQTEFVLNYNTDNATIGTFPMSYTNTNSDTAAGSFTYTTYNGTFEGTVDTTIDAYGTLSMNDLGQGAYSSDVTRLKTVQSFNLSYNIFTNVGTAVLTMYNYYDDTNGNLVFRTNTLVINVPLLGINQTTTIMESMLTSTLGVNDNNLQLSQVKIVPNPVEDILNISLTNNQIIRSISLIDLNGRVVLNIEGDIRNISVDHLKKGLYFATITTEENSITRKFIKR